MGVNPTRQHAPAGSTLSSYEGNDMVEALGEAITKYGDGASMQAVMRMNVEQSS